MVERIEREEGELLDALLKTRHDAGLSQAQVAERIGTHAPAVARLERALATGKHSPSLATLRKYVDVCGKQLAQGGGNGVAAAYARLKGQRTGVGLTASGEHAMA